MTRADGVRVLAELSLTVQEVSGLGVWLRAVGESVSSGLAIPDMYWTVEPEFAADATGVVGDEAVIRWYVYDPRAPSQQVTSLIAFPAVHIDIRADRAQLEAWADEWQRQLAEVS